ncbi:MAG TPA: VWA domain-containing protein [Gemmataceae bacterium]
MRTRHKTPSIFNLSMVDVLCCALGCVILLWLLNLRVAREKTLQASESSQQLDLTKTDRDLLSKLREEDRQNLAERDREIGFLYEELQRQDAEVTTSARRLSDVLEKLHTSEERVKALGLVADKVPTLEADAKKRNMELADARKAALALDTTKSTLEKDLEAREKALSETREKLKEQEKAMAAARESLEKGDKDALAMRDKLTLLEKESTERAKEMTTASRIIDNLRDEKKKLGTDVDKLRAAAENRFEGIALTGRRVVFLVDMSGSMELVDENTEAPHKWQGVRDTVARILKSLPDLEKFQVIIFSDKSRFLLGNNGWIDFEGKATVDRVTSALSEIKPKGGTNMYAALDAAFRFRATGLDTIYLLSDGLPNQGEGATPEQVRTLKETDLGEILGKVIRKKLKNDWNKAVQDKPRVRINAVGFFYESPDVGAFLWALARENDGSFVGMSKP